MSVEGSLILCPFRQNNNKEIAGTGDKPGHGLSVRFIVPNLCLLLWNTPYV